MDLTSLDERIADLTSALGDPTRRAIYVAVRESSEPMTTSRIAQLFDIHPNVARHHLDKLADDGWLIVSRQRASGRSGPGAGRPAKTYQASKREVSIHFAPRRYELLVDLLMRVINEIAPEGVSEIAQRVGYEYGRELAKEIGAPEDAGYTHAIQAVAMAMTGLGFSMDPDVEGERLLTTHCPFGDAATDHPDVVCSLDRGIVSGLAGGLGASAEPVLIPHSQPEDQCVTRVPVTIR
ncbi:MAG TPA: helix-turn-helix domain-containing protein [Acidimicrobiia bacterium]|jgi:predicted ArsR family transcriptional regulator|nr:helix-turn-helix domain-containing protein [Acidimicrobiia bacterium]